MQLRKLLAATAVAAGAFAAQPALAQDITLEFVVWNYSLETIQDNIRQFEEANPGIKVNVTDYAWQDYQDSLVLRIRGNTPTDVVYGGQDWLPAWGAAGFIAPLDSVAPAADIEALKADIAGFALTDVTYKDKEIAGQKLDLLVESCVIVEVKAVAKLEQIHGSQLVS